MRNSALNEKMRLVDLGVAVCVDAIIKHSEALQDETLTESQQAQHKAKIRENTHTYKQALDELLSVLDADDPQADIAKNPQNPTACKLPTEFKIFPHLEPLNMGEAKSLDDKLNLFHTQLITFATLPELVQFCATNDRLHLADLAEVFKVYGAYLSEQFTHLHHFALDHYNAKGEIMISLVGIKDKAIDEAMMDLINVIEVAENFPFIVHSLIETVGNKEKLEEALYNLATAEKIVFEKINQKKDVLVEMLVKGGSDE